MSYEIPVVNLNESHKGSILTVKLWGFRSPNEFSLKKNGGVLSSTEIIRGSLMILPINGTAKWESGLRRIEQKMTSIRTLQVKIHDHDWDGRALVEIVNNGTNFASDLVEEKLAVAFTSPEEFKEAHRKLLDAEVEKARQRQQLQEAKKKNRKKQKPCAAGAASVRQCETPQNDLASMNNNLQRLRDIISTMQTDHETEITQARKELVDAHAAKLSALQKQRKEHDLSCHRLQTELAETRAALASKEKVFAEYQQQSQEQGQHAQISLENFREQAKLDLAVVQEELAQANQSLESKTALIQKQQGELVAISALNSAYEAKFIRSDEKIKQGREEIEFLHKQVSQLQNALASKEDASDKLLGDRLAELEKFQESAISKDNEAVHNVSQQVDDCAKEVNDLLSALKEKSDKSRAQIERFGEELFNMKSAVAVLSAFDDQARCLLNIQQNLARFHENSDSCSRASKDILKPETDVSEHPLKSFSNKSENLKNQAAFGESECAIALGKDGSALQSRINLKRSIVENATEIVEFSNKSKMARLSIEFDSLPDQDLVGEPIILHDNNTSVLKDNDNGDFHDAILDQN